MKDLKEINKMLQDHKKRIRALEIHVLPVKRGKRGAITEKTGANNSDTLILAIVNKTSECDKSEEIQSKVLDKASMDGKILLCFYISYKYFKNAWLTTGDVEKITSGLGTKITAGNASNKITGELRKYLESGAVRKKGQPTPYRLNRKGVKRFEEIIHSKDE